jgi:hypothetical protein
MSDAGWPRNEQQTGGLDRVGRLENIILYGNGKPGLTTRMVEVEKDIKLIQELEERRTKKLDRIEVAVVIGVILMILNLISTHIH